MTKAYLDPKSYTFKGGFTIPSGRDLIIPESLILSQTMLVKWQIRNLAKGVTIDQIPPAILSTSLEIPGLGILEGDDYQIVASQQGRDRVQLITLDPTLPHKLLFNQVSDLVTNSVLEFYTSHQQMANLNNPNKPVDLSPLVSAIQDGSAAQVAATQAAAAEDDKKIKRLDDIEYITTQWDGVHGNHIAVQPDRERVGCSIFADYGGGEIIIDLFLNIADKEPKLQEDAVIQPGGTYTLSESEASLGVLLYSSTGQPDGIAKISLQYSTPAAQSASPAA